MNGIVSLFFSVISSNIYIIFCACRKRGIGPKT